MPRLLNVSLLALAASMPVTVGAQEAQPAKPVYRPIATTAFRVGSFQLLLRTDTQTLAGLSPLAEPGFDFGPGKREPERQGDGYNHVGDIDVRLRTPGGSTLR